MAVKQQSGGAQPGNTAAVDLLGVSLAGLQSQINALGEVDRSLTSSVSEPEIDFSFTPTFRVEKKWVFVTIGILFPPGTIEVIVQLVKTADRIISQASFEQFMFHTAIRDLTPAEVSSGRVVREIPTTKHGLEYGTTYDIPRLKVHTLSAGAGAEVANPEGDILFTDVPLLQFTTPDRFGVPSSPRLLDILLNSLDSFTEDFDCKVRVRIYAPLTATGTAQTWGASGTDEVMAAFTRTSTGDRIKLKRLLTGVELTQTSATSPGVANRGFVDLDVTGFKPGADYTWDKNTCWAQGDQKDSTGAPVSFPAGNFSRDPTTLIAPSLAITQDDSRRASVELNATQPATIIALKWVRVRRKLKGSADPFVTVIKKFTLRADIYYVVGPIGPIMLDDTVKTKPAKEYTWEVTICAVGGLQMVFTQDSTGSTALDVPAKSNQRTHKNMIEGGAFLVNRFDFDGVSAVTDVGKRWALSTAGVDHINSLATGVGGASIDIGGVQWDQPNHRLVLTDNSPAGTGFFTLGGKVCCQVRKQIVAGETYNLTLMIKAATGYTSNFSCELYDHGNTQVIPGCSVLITNYVVTTAYTVLFALFTVQSSYAMSTGKQWVRFYMSSNPSFDTYLDNWCLVRGEIPPAWAPGDEEGSIDSSVNVAVDTGVGAIGAVSGGMYSGDGTFYGSAGSFGGRLVY